jgi:dTMP kinase
MGLPGVFVTFEGGEGVGKTTVLGELAKGLRARGLQVVVTREPGGTPVADAIRRVFAGAQYEEVILPLTELYLVCAARHQHVKLVIEPALAAGKWVLCDRFVDSSRVYQGALGGIADADIVQLSSLATQGLKPHLTFLLDCDPGVSLARLSKRPRTNAVETAARYDHAALSVHQKIREAYLRIAADEPARIASIQADQPLASILENVWAKLGSLLYG